MKTILVTGASGFIGSHLCDKLTNLGQNVIALGKKNENTVICKKLYSCDLNNIPIKNLPDIDVCFHLSANNDTQSENEIDIMKSNLYDPIILFENLLHKKCKKFIFASSCAVYGNQPTPFVEEETPTECLTHYAKSKLLFEEFAKNFSKEKQVCCVGLRYSNVYGKNEKHKNKRASMIYQIINKFLNKEKIYLFKNGEQKRDWVHIDDVTEANLLSMNCSESNIFNIGSGVSSSFNQIIEIISKKFEFGELFVEYIDCHFKNSYQTNTSLNIDKAKKILGYFPKYSLDMGVASFFN